VLPHKSARCFLRGYTTLPRGFSVVTFFASNGADASSLFEQSHWLIWPNQSMLPDMNLVSTSYIERQNLTMRMSMRRFTRLTNGFSKKIENHMHAIAIHYMYYNFARIQQITSLLASDGRRGYQYAVVN